MQNPYEIEFQKATNEETREQFWEEKAKEIEWKKFPTTILDKTHPNPGLWRWFKDGELNISYNCLDRHLEELAERPCIHWYSSMVKQERTYSWQEVHSSVCKLANLYTKLGVK